jgi:hypothetical protein
MNGPTVLYTLKNTRPYVFVPPVVVALLLPLGLLAVAAKGDDGAVGVYFSFCLNLLLPAFACWWPLFVWRDRLEGEGRELLYLLRRTGEGGTAALLIVGYCALLVPLAFAGMTTPVGFSPTDAVLACARNALLISLVFWASFVLSSGPLALVLAFGFSLAVMHPLEYALESIGPTLSVKSEPGIPILTLGLYGLASAAMLIHGEIRSRVFTG